MSIILTTTNLLACSVSWLEHTKAFFATLFIVVIGAPLCAVILTCGGWLSYHMIFGFLSEGRATWFSELGGTFSRRARRFTKASQQQLDEHLSYVTTQQNNCADLGRRMGDLSQLVCRSGIRKIFSPQTPLERARHEMLENEYLSLRLVKRAIATKGVAKTSTDYTYLNTLKSEIEETRDCCRKCLKHNRKRQHLSGEGRFDHECLLEQRAIFKG